MSNTDIREDRRFDEQNDRIKKDYRDYLAISKYWVSEKKLDKIFKQEGDVWQLICRSVTNTFDVPIQSRIKSYFRILNDEWTEAAYHARGLAIARMKNIYRQSREQYEFLRYESLKEEASGVSSTESNSDEWLMTRANPRLWMSTAGYIATSTYRECNRVKTEHKELKRNDLELKQNLIKSCDVDWAAEENLALSAEAIFFRKLRIEMAFEQLTPDERELVTLRCINDKNFDDIGKELGIPANTANARMLRISERLRGLAKAEQKLEKAGS